MGLSNLSGLCSVAAGAIASCLLLIHPAQPSSSIKWRGVNIAGAEFAADRLPGRINFDYHYPTNEELEDVIASGSNIIRLPFLWERLQPALGENLNEAEAANLQQAVQSARRLGLAVILDPHNYGAFRGELIGTDRVPEAMFADLWRRLARLFPNDADLIFGLMNEPHRQSARQWAKIAQAAVFAIRAEGSVNWILVPGSRWTGAHSWNASVGGLSNAEALADFKDPVDRVIFEMHQYFDADSSGTHSDCVSSDEMLERLKGAETWLERFDRKGFVAEFGVSDRPACLEALRVFLGRLESSRVWVGWTYWAASEWFGNYMFNAYPAEKTAQGAVLKQFLRGARN